MYIGSHNSLSVQVAVQKALFGAQPDQQRFQMGEKIQLGLAPGQSMAYGHRQLLNIAARRQFPQPKEGKEYSVALRHRLAIISGTLAMEGGGQPPMEWDHRYSWPAARVGRNHQERGPDAVHPIIAGNDELVRTIRDMSHMVHSTLQPLRSIFSYRTTWIGSNGVLPPVAGYKCTKFEAAKPGWVIAEEKEDTESVAERLQNMDLSAPRRKVLRKDQREKPRPKRSDKEERESDDS